MSTNSNTLVQDESSCSGSSTQSEEQEACSLSDLPDYHRPSNLPQPLQQSQSNPNHHPELNEEEDLSQKLSNHMTLTTHHHNNESSPSTSTSSYEHVRLDLRRPQGHPDTTTSTSEGHDVDGGDPIKGQDLCNGYATNAHQVQVQEGPIRLPNLEPPGIDYVSYESELQMPSIMKLIQKDLSEPYSIYTYRYFIHNWPRLCFLAMDESLVVGAIVCKLDVHKQNSRRGYIAMLAVDEKYRRRNIGSSLVLQSIRAMAAEDADEIVLETEITNKSALRLYENLGFVRDKRLFRYYLNGVDALRLKLWLK